jgi:hypothetical protein
MQQREYEPKIVIYISNHFYLLSYCTFSSEDAQGMLKAFNVQKKAVDYFYI